ncbi:hypothetical protein [Membranihabitans maritimus]|uniref:hypothetical protein n=1 Tax=Membranihabitans maritimus TaxID=2904244 RepID=UPI001F3B57DB|nr:hypothetical protein [Membranihabitans maritimus]
MAKDKGGRIAANFRKANIAEELAILLFKPFCAIAKVTRQEDYGIDFIGTLLKRTGKIYSAQDSFVAQIKIQSSPRFEFSGEGVNWLKSLRLPYFPIIVNLEKSSVSLYTLNRWHHPIFTSILTQYNFVVQNDYDEGDGLNDFPLEEPIMEWSIQDTTDGNFADWAYNILKIIVEIETRNFQFGNLWKFEKFEFKTFKFDPNNPIPKTENINTSILEIPPGLPEEVKKLINRAVSSLPDWIANQLYESDKSEAVLKLKDALKELNIERNSDEKWNLLAKEMKAYYERK